ncbi:MAG TPA: sensor domain-containing diguanylate cyclase [Acidimicrobiales bacterium]|nr:sensor domain-containing diguanylate cyclase [Acidimicrobiales bacterium]
MRQDERPQPAAESPSGTDVWPEPRRPRTATLLKDTNGVIRSVDARVSPMLGWGPEHLVGARSVEFYHPDDLRVALASWDQFLADRESARARVRHRCADGTWLWVECEHAYSGPDDRGHVQVLTQLTDISDEMAAYEALHRREELFRRLAESVPVGLVQLGDGGVIIYANTRASEILGPDMSTEDFDSLTQVFPDAQRLALEAAFADAVRTGAERRLEIAFNYAHGAEERHCATSIMRMSGEGEETLVLICLEDVTEAAQMRKELENRATFDPLTRCFNRASTMNAVEAALARPGAGRTGAIFVDLDGFKPVNDRLGHAAGDRLLACVGERLASCVRRDDVAGRLGGDEFLLLCLGLSGPAELLAVAERARERLEEPVDLEGEVVSVRASIGACYPEDEVTADELVARADAAMYESKRQGNGLPVIFSRLLSASR